ncbi:MAG: hypothetical protein ACRDFS_05965 [Chloroflexota bacterium]
MATQESTFTSEEITNPSKENANGVLLGAIAIFKEQGQPVDALFRRLSEILAPGWEEIKRKGAQAVSSDWPRLVPI